jgi:hypothetical protein
MRRILILVTSLGLLGGAVGCYCMHGVCDCDVQPPGAPTGYFGPYGGHAPLAPAVGPAVGPVGVSPVTPVPYLRPEPLKEPKVGLSSTAEPPIGGIGR